MRNPPLTQADVEAVLRDYPDASKAEAASKRRASGVKPKPVDYDGMFGRNLAKAAWAKRMLETNKTVTLGT